MLHPVIAFMASGGGELIIIMLALLLLFGPKDAPRMLRSIQNVLNKLQRAAADFRYKLMYNDLHWNQTEEPKDPPVHDTEELPADDSSAEETHDLPPGHPSADEPET